MNTYKVSLHRDYIVNIDAKNEEEAMFLAEFLMPEKKMLPQKKNVNSTALE